MKRYFHPKMNLTKSEINKLEGMWEKNKKQQDELFKMMIDVTDALEKIGIKYTLAGGTALGAYLYRDFIPWDDDVDIFINYEDYDNLLTKLQKNLPGKYQLISSKTHNKYMYPFPKIINKEIKLKKPEFGERKEFAYLWVDINLIKSYNKPRMPKAISFWGKVMWMKNADVHPLVNPLMKMVVPFTQSFINKRIFNSIDKAKPGNYSIEPFPYRRTSLDAMIIDGKDELSFRDKKFSVFANPENKFIAEYGNGIYEIPKKSETHGIEV